MYPGKPCEHCTSQGCAIYETRPTNPCVIFNCGWLIEESPLPEEMRPDKSGAIVMLDKKWGGWRIIYASPTGERIPEKTLDWLMAYAREHKIPLMYRENLMEEGKLPGHKRLGYGPPAFLEAVKNSMSLDDIKMR